MLRTSVLYGAVIFAFSAAGPLAGLAQTLTGAIPVGPQANIGSWAWMVAVNPASNKIYVPNSAEGTVTVIDGATNQTSTIAVGVLPIAIAVNPATNRIYVANWGSNNITVIDGATNATSTIASGAQPRAVAVNPATNKIYVANYGSANLTMIDGSSNATTTIATGSWLHPYALAVNSFTNKIYVASSQDYWGDITVIDGATYAASEVASLYAIPWDMVVNPVTDKVYVEYQDSGGGALLVIDGRTNSTSTVPLGGTPWYWPTNLFGMAVNPATNKIYVANYSEGKVIELNGATNDTEAVIVGGHPTAVAVNPTTDDIYVLDESSAKLWVIEGATKLTKTVNLGRPAANLALNPVTNKIYVADAGQPDQRLSARVTVVDGARNRTTILSLTTASPSVSAVNPVTNKIYVADASTNTAEVIDGETNQTITAFQVGKRPSAMAVNPATNKIYVLNDGYIPLPCNCFEPGTLSVIDGSTDAVSATLPAGLIPRSLAVNPATNKIYVGNLETNTVTVIDGATNEASTVVLGPPGPYFPREMDLDPTTSRFLMGDIAVNVAANKIYVLQRLYGLDSNGWGLGFGRLTEIDGATNATQTLSLPGYPLLERGLVVNSTTNKVYALTYTTRSILNVIDGATGETSTLELGLASGASIGVNPVSNKIYVGYHNASQVAVIDGATNDVRTLPVGLAGIWASPIVAVNTAMNKVYVTFENDSFFYYDFISIIDGATNSSSTITVTHAWTRLAMNPVTNKVYVPTGVRRLTVLDPAQAQPLPLVTSIEALPDNVTVERTPTFSFTAISSYQPFAPEVLGVWYRVDDLQGPWLPADKLGGGYSAQLSSPPLGFHILYAYAVDGSDATALAKSETVIGRLTAYPFTVLAGATTVSLVSDLNPATPADNVNFSASVTVDAPGSGTPTGTVTFKDGAVELGTVGLNNSGQATFAASPMSVGSHSITAVYSGDANFHGSISAALIQVVSELDNTPPIITPNISGTLGNNGWYTGTVTVSWSVSDAESAVTSQTGCESTNITSDTTGATLTCTATSAGGTSSESVTIKRDATPPTVTASASPAPNAAGWNNSNVTVSYTCTDVVSGVASVSPATTLSTEGTGLSATGTCTDDAGKMASATVSGINIDKTAPVITLVGDATMTVEMGTAFTDPGATATDSGGSGPATVTVAGSVDSQTAATYELTYTATDSAGNTATVKRTVIVVDTSGTPVWTVDGFYQPVTMNAENVVKAGSTVPLKFNVFRNGVEQTALGAIASFNYGRIDCGQTSGLADITIETASSGGTSLRYDSVAGYFIQNWQVPKGAGLCYAVLLSAQGGQPIIAYFRTK